MNIEVINSSSLGSFDYLLFPDQNPNNQLFIQNQLNNFSSTLTDAGKKFMEASKQLYDKINDSNSIRLAKAALRSVRGFLHPNKIINIETLDEIRAAQPVMQRYIMAEPTIRTLFHEQRVDGYSDSYVDQEPNKVGVDHYDYRRVNNGIVHEKVVDGVNSWGFNFYPDQLFEQDRELDSVEKFDILSTWEIMKMFVESGQDPTNVFGGTL